MFSDVLDAARDHLEPGRSVVLTVEATLEGEELQAARQGAPSRSTWRSPAPPAPGVDLLDDAAAAPSLAARLAGGARRGPRRHGPVNLV